MAGEVVPKSNLDGEAEAAVAMEMTETLEASADAAGIAATSARAVAGEVSASVEDINTTPSSIGENKGRQRGKSLVGGGGSSYMGSSAGAGSGGGGDGTSGASGGGLMGSSSTVKTYRHPTSSRQRNLIRERFMKALEPFHNEDADKYTPLTAAIAIEHSMYRYFGKVGGRLGCRV
jgi:hypothetical protein